MSEMPYARTLKTALKNAVKPSYDIHVVCPECSKEVTTNNGEWLIWCGGKEHADEILKAARYCADLAAPQVSDDDKAATLARFKASRQHLRGHGMSFTDLDRIEASLKAPAVQAVPREAVQKFIDAKTEWQISRATGDLVLEHEKAMNFNIAANNLLKALSLLGGKGGG